MQSRTRKLIGAVLAVSLLAAAAAAFGGCSSDAGGDTPADEGTPKPGGALVFPLPGEPVSIEPLNAQDASGLQVAHQVFQGLTKWVRNDDGVLVTEPDIAVSWESADAQTWVFHLREDVTFQPPVSRAVTAQDFLDSWTRVTDPENQSYVAYILAPIEGLDDRGYQTDPEQGLTGVTVVDDQTLQVTLRYPFADFPATLGHPVAAVTPVDYIDEVGAKVFARAPVGTGAYAVQSWRHKEEIRLVKNPTYWDAEQPGWVDAVQLPIYDDVDAMWEDFQAGRLDCSQVPVEQLPAATASPGAAGDGRTAGSWPAAAVYLVGINMTDPTLGASLDLRKALSQSAAAQAVVDEVGLGVDEVAGGYVPPGIPGYKDAQNPYPYDPEGAAAVVTTMGGAPTLNYWYDVSDDHRRIGETLAAGWAGAGLKVKPSGYEWGTFLEKLSRGDKGSGSQLFRIAWIADYPSMDAFLYPLFQSDQSPTGSYTFYSNAGVDELLQKARATMDAQQRQNLYAQAEKLILTDMPALPLYSYRYHRVVGPRLHGFAVDPMGTTDMRSVWIE
ncbi:MAG: ABC transporter substrate-binding protein [Actinobacteria bacterium]|nr:ABC transporter substrate-binding protein [Actinomycetota bacterium]